MNDIVFMPGTETREEQLRAVINGVLNLLAQRAIVDIGNFVPVQVRDSGVHGNTVIQWRKGGMMLSDELLVSEDAVTVIAQYCETRHWARSLTP